MKTLKLYSGNGSFLVALHHAHSAMSDVWLVIDPDMAAWASHLVRAVGSLSPS